MPIAMHPFLYFRKVFYIICPTRVSDHMRSPCALSIELTSASQVCINMNLSGIRLANHFPGIVVLVLCLYSLYEYKSTTCICNARFRNWHVIPYSMM